MSAGAVPAAAHLPGALREAERSFAMVVDAIDDHAIFMIARDGTIMTWNSGAERMKGYAPDEIIGTPYGRLFDQASPDPFGAADILNAAAIAGHYRGEGWRLRKDGSRFLADFTLHAVRDAGGDVIGFAKITRDISEQRAAEARLAESERAYRLVADHSSDIIARLGMDGLRKFVSPACFAVFGYTPEEIIERNPLGDLHPDDRARVVAALRAQFEMSSDLVLRYRHQHRDGHYVWMETSYRLIRDPLTGEPFEFITVARDISRHYAMELESAAAEARLQEQARLLEMAEQAAQLGHWRVDALDREIFWSDAVFHIHGMTPGGKPDLAAAIAAYHPDDRAMVQQASSAALEEGVPFAFRARLLRTDGTIVHVASQGRVTRLPDGTIVDVFGTFQDISEHVANEARLSAALAGARVAERAKADFLATMSHEIRTPMTGVLGMIELLREEPSRAVRDTLFTTLDSSTRTLMRILDDVLDYSQAHSHKLTLHPAPFDLRALAETSIALFTHAAQAKGLALTLDFPAGAARLVGDAARLQQIMFNLLSNAIKFTATGSVTLSVAAPDAPANIWTVRVRDTGIGLPDQAQATLFRPFAQGDTSIARRFGGTGLGLAISLKLAEAMGGSLTAEAVTGSGACLRLDLPLASAGDVTTNEPDAVGIPTRARTVLVAEDHPANRLLLETWLRRQGHQVCCVDDGAAAVAEVVTTRFDLVLMDLQMPEMDGIAASRAIRELAGAAALTPIVALSADVLSHREDQLAAVGVVDRLAKPIDFALLASVLETLPDRNEASPATIDPAKLDQLLGLMTDEETARFIALIDDELVNATARLVVALRRGDDALARRLAHRSIGALTNIGAMALIALLRPIADGPVIERRAQVIAAIVTAAAATRLHIGKYVQLRSSAVNAE